MRSDRDAILTRFVADGLIRVEGTRHRTTRRWQGAMSRAAVQLMGAGDDGADLRLPIARALIDIYGVDLPDTEAVAMVEALLPIESAELHPG